MDVLFLNTTYFSDPIVEDSFYLVNTLKLTCVGLAFAIATITITAVSRNRGFTCLSHVPGPIASHLGDIYRLYLAFDGQGPKRYCKLHERYGTVVRTGWNHILVANPVYITNIYDTRGEFLKSDLYRVFSLFHDSRIMETMLNVRDRAEHKRLTLQVSTKLSGSSFRRREPSFDKCYDQIIELLKTSDGMPIDLQPLLKLWGLDMNTVALFNHESGFVQNRGDMYNLIASVDKGFRLGPLLGQLPYLLGFVLDSKWIMWFLRRVCKMRDPGEEVVLCAETMMRKLDAVLKDDDDCIYTSLRRDLRRGKQHVREIDIMNHLGNLQLAGAFAIPSALVSVFYFLLHNQQAYRLVLAEITEATAAIEKAEYISFKAAAQLPYIEAVIMESLRLCPTNGLPIERIVPDGGLMVDGLYIPPGTNIAMCAPVVHRDPVVFGADPDEFRPGRWIDDDPDVLLRRRASFLSFGRGRRSCAGHARSMMQMSKFLVEIFRRFDVQWAGGPDPWKVRHYWMPEQNGVVVRFKSRDSQ